MGFLEDARKAKQRQEELLAQNPGADKETRKRLRDQAIAEMQETGTSDLSRLPRTVGELDRLPLEQLSTEILTAFFAPGSEGQTTGRYLDEVVFAVNRHTSTAEHSSLTKAAGKMLSRSQEPARSNGQDADDLVKEAFQQLEQWRLICRDDLYYVGDQSPRAHFFLTRAGRQWFEQASGAV